MLIAGKYLERLLLIDYFQAPVLSSLKDKGL
jgi:hypothetical protein